MLLSIYVEAITNRSGCPQCAHQKVILGETDLESMYPDVAEQAYGWDPGEVMPGSHQVKDWICQYGHIWPSPINIRVKGSGCPYCRGYYPIISETDLKILSVSVIRTNPIVFVRK